MNKIKDIDYLRLFNISLFLFLILSFILIIALPQFKIPKAPVRADAFGYFSYLPAIFIKQDLSFNYLIDENVPNTEGENTYNAIYNKYQARGMGFNYIESTQKYLNKYPTGVAILLTPFYLLGHVLTVIFGFEQSGYSYFYQYLCFFGGLFYFVLGIYFLERFLLKFFSKKVVLATLLIIILGTNLLNYATFENIYSHVYSFFLVALLLLTSTWWVGSLDSKKQIVNSKKVAYAVLLGVNLGLIVAVRQTNVIFALIPIVLVLQFCKWKFLDIKNFTLQNFKSIFLLFTFGFFTLLPQLLYWKFAANSFFVNSYVGEGFSFSNTHFFESLFSIDRGLFVWSPLLILGIVGFAVLLRRGSRLGVQFNGLQHIVEGTLLILLIQWIIVSTWGAWTFGWGYGHRVFVDSLPLFAVGIALVLHRSKGLQPLVKTLLRTLVVGLILLSIFQTFQYWMRILPPEFKTIQDYQYIFLRLDRTPGWWK